ncbi:MAG: inositol monophosphatase [Chloroflexi bacterium]|nr:inositol monophosphatase family protein [Chloroflexota bacterium]MQC18951.1 inositol monophosphatase [Chloroflexota bacterium]
MTPPDPVALRDLAVRAAQEAGALLLDRLASERTVNTKSSATDVVTEVDVAAEAMLLARLLGERPDDGILGEEGTSRAGTSGVRWVVDPLDGTVNYLYRIPGFSVSVAAEVDGTVVAGCVFDPSRRETFAVALGYGATLNGVRLAVSPVGDLAQALIGTGFGYEAAVRDRQGRVLSHVISRVRDIRRGGSAALDLCWVACGRLDGYFERGLQPWDGAAGGLVVREAGGHAAPLEAAAGPAAGTWIAAGSALHGPLITLVMEAERLAT